MAEIQPMGLPNLVSQGDQLARARAQAGSETVAEDRHAIERQRNAVRRAGELPRVARVEPTGERRRDARRDERGEEGEDPHERLAWDVPDEDDEHRLDVTA
jgi:hypothetical protein